MEKRKNLLGLNFINALLLLILFLIQYNATFNLNISSATPMLPLAFLVAMCMFCSEIRGALTGLVVGIFIDAVANTPQGFNAIMFCFLGLCSVLIVKHFFNNNILSALTLCGLCTLFYFIIRWILTYAFYISFTENLKYVIGTAVPSGIYTAIFVIPFYYLQKFLYKKLQK